MSLNRVYDTGLKHAVDMILKNKGSEDGEHLTIACQVPVTLALEKGFGGMFPVEKKSLRTVLDKMNQETGFEIKGCGFVVTGAAFKENQMADEVLQMDLYVDNVLSGTIKLPTNYLIRRNELAWKYELEEGNHQIRLVGKNLKDGYGIQTAELIVYSNTDPGNANY
jgi:hypothetical protein